jgi:uncharacterized delta-60 repeat protein
MLESLESRQLLAADGAFGTGGIVVTDFPGPSAAWAADVVVQPDGNLVAVGRASGADGADFGLARYLPSGALDPSFGVGGRVTTNFGGAVPGYDRAQAVALQPDGRIVVAGVTGFFWAADVALARYLPTGALDPDFGVGGLVTTNSGFSIIGGTPDLDAAFDVLVQPDGRIVVAGVAEALTDYGVHSDFLLARYNADGTLDAAFAPDEARDPPGSPPFGMATTNFGGLGAPVLATVPDLDGSGAPLGTYHSFATTTFSEVLSGEGYVAPVGYALNDLAHAVALGADGSLTVVGGTWRFDGSFSAMSVARYGSDGSLAGQYVADLGPGAVADEAQAVLLLEGGGWVVAGSASVPDGGVDAALIRYSAAGLPDPSFSGDGVAIFPLTPDGDVFKAVAPGPAGTLRLAGVAGVTAVFMDEMGLDVPAPMRLLGGDLLLASVTADGALDVSYDGDGLRLVDLDASPQANAVASQPDGLLVVAGQVLTAGVDENFLLLREDFAPGAANRPPVAVADLGATTDREPITIDVLANDSDPDGDPLTLLAVSTPAVGSAEIVDGGVRYTPPINFSGVVPLVYTVGDGRGGVAMAPITLSIEDVTAPQVVAVLVSGVGWTLPPQPVPIGAAARPLPWVNINQLHVRFSEPVTVSAAALTLLGAAVPSYAITGMTYDPVTWTATWTLGRTIGADRLLIDLADSILDDSGNALDGEWTNPAPGVPGSSFPSGDGAAGGRFQFRFDVLPGDFNGSGEVSAADLTAVLALVRAHSYSPYADLDGDGDVDRDDAFEVVARLRRKLPPRPPRHP